MKREVSQTWKELSALGGFHEYDSSAFGEMRTSYQLLRDWPKDSIWISSCNLRSIKAGGNPPSPPSPLLSPPAPPPLTVSWRGASSCCWCTREEIGMVETVVWFLIGWKMMKDVMGLDGLSEKSIMKQKSDGKSALDPLPGWSVHESAGIVHDLSTHPSRGSNLPDAGKVGEGKKKKLQTISFRTHVDTEIASYVSKLLRAQREERRHSMPIKELLSLKSFVLPYRGRRINS